MRRSIPVPNPSVSALPAALRLVLPVFLVTSGYLIGARAGHVFPFERGGGVAPTVAMAELPPEFPVPARGSVEFAGGGEQLPYRIVWLTSRPPDQVAAVYQAMLETARWELMLEEETGPAYRVRIARIGDEGDMTHFATLAVTPSEGGSRVDLEFIRTGGGAVHFR